MDFSQRRTICRRKTGDDEAPHEFSGTPSVSPNNSNVQNIENELLVKEWQDWVLAHGIAVNYLNILMVLASKQDFAFVVPANYSIRYVQHTGSFQQTVSQLATDMRTALTNARADLNRVHVGMADVPNRLQTMALLVKEAPYNMLMTLFPESFNDIEKLVNDSLLVLRKPEENFKRVLNFLAEIELLTNATSNQVIALQVVDLKSQWVFLTELMIELTKAAETTRENFILQFNWVLKEFIRAGPMFPDVLREFIISLLLPKIVEIDRASDLLGTITKTYSDASSQIIDQVANSYAHLLLLNNERDRQQYISQFRHELPPQAVQVARLALKQHKEFLQHDLNRQPNYKHILVDASQTGLTNAAA